jgi:uncharacterized protein YceH (UPF0502 family)
MLIMKTRKRAGRPRQHKDEKSRVKAWRSKQTGSRLDVYVHRSASWRLKKLAKTWGCSLAIVVERLAMEADERYGDILSSEVDNESSNQRAALMAAKIKAKIKAKITALHTTQRSAQESTYSGPE